jgi:hypothetical protein
MTGSGTTPINGKSRAGIGGVTQAMVQETLHQT